MKKLLSLFLVLSFLLPALSMAASTEKSQVEKLKSTITQSYNMLNGLSDAQWGKYFGAMSAKLAAEGKTTEAETMAVFADPSMKEEVLAAYSQKVAELSNNAIIALILYSASNGGRHGGGVIWWGGLWISGSPEEVILAIFLTIFILGEEDQASEV
jgi:hypothetical protein